MNKEILYQANKTEIKWDEKIKLVTITIYLAEKILLHIPAVKYFNYNKKTTKF